jgi:hypothetical protein
MKDENSITQLKASLNSELASLNKLDYDTEEKGFNGKGALKQPDILPFLLHLSNAFKSLIFKKE